MRRTDDDEAELLCTDVSNRLEATDGVKASVVVNTTESRDSTDARAAMEIDLMMYC